MAVKFFADRIAVRGRKEPSSSGQRLVHDRHAKNAKTIRPHMAVASRMAHTQPVPKSPVSSSMTDYLKGFRCLLSGGTGGRGGFLRLGEEPALCEAATDVETVAER